MKTQVAGHVAIDRIVTLEGESFRLGGPPSYICSVADALGLDIKVITRVGHDFPEEYHKTFSEWGVDLRKWVCEKPTTRFILDYTSNPRRIGIKTVCEPIELSEQHYESVILSPIAGEINEKQVLAIDSDFLALDPQGYIREINPPGDIPLKKWSHRSLGNINLLKSSVDEHMYITGESNLHRSLKMLAGKGVDVSVITMGKEGSLVHADGDTFQVPVYPSEPIDSTGAGDCYLAGATKGLIEGESVEWSCALGSAISSAILETEGPVMNATSTDINNRAEWVYDRIEKS